MGFRTARTTQKEKKALIALPKDSVSVISIHRKWFRGLMSSPAFSGTRHTMVHVHTCGQNSHTYIKNKIFNKKRETPRFECQACLRLIECHRLYMTLS